MADTPPTPTDALLPIERDEAMNRDYIPLPGGWEIQTKGKGSTFRVLDRNTGERYIVMDPDAPEWLVKMATDIRAALSPKVGADDEALLVRVVLAETNATHFRGTQFEAHYNEIARQANEALRRRIAELRAEVKACRVKTIEECAVEMDKLAALTGSQWDNPTNAAAIIRALATKEPTNG